MTGAIPPYGEHFRLESLPYDQSHTYASRHYVLKRDANWDVISDPKSEHWVVRFRYLRVSDDHDRFTDAMMSCQLAYEALHPRTKARGV
jgi:hypothetical protein